MRTHLLFPLPLLILLLLLPSTTALPLPVNISRLQTHLATLSTHNDLTPPSVQRILYTPSDISSRAYLKSLFRKTGLTIHEDALGNIFGTWPAPSPGVLTGSHFDAIPNSGMYDGTLGILSALEAITALSQSGFVPNRSITVIAFTSEEPTRFGLSCIGSRVLSGALAPAKLTYLTDHDGVPFHDARAAAGYNTDVRAVPLVGGEYTAFVELHSEQGPLLEDGREDIGAVTAIAAPAALVVTFTGPGGHAGTMLMRERSDPSLAVAELSLAVEAAVNRYGGEDTVGTTGYVDITPNAINSVPTMARVGIDVRDIDHARRDRVLRVVENSARVIAKGRGVGVEIVYNSRDAPAKCDQRIADTVVDVAKANGLKVRRMVSRAYHDALFMARVMPTGMIFVPCRGGISHRPDEFVSKGDMENGVRVLAGVLRRLVGDAEKEGESKRDEQSAEDSVDEIESIHEEVDDVLTSAGKKHDGDVEDEASEGDDGMMAERSGIESAKREASEKKFGNFGDGEIRIRRSREPKVTKMSKPSVTGDGKNEIGQTCDRKAPESKEPKTTEYTDRKPTVKGATVLGSSESTVTEPSKHMATSSSMPTGSVKPEVLETGTGRYSPEDEKEVVEMSSEMVVTVDL